MSKIETEMCVHQQPMVIAWQSAHFSYVYPLIIAYLYITVNKVALERKDTLVVLLVRIDRG